MFKFSDALWRMFESSGSITAYVFYRDFLQQESN